MVFNMKRPDFDSIKTYEEFKKYDWHRVDLQEICKDHGLLFLGTEKKLNKVIEAYFNGVKIPPRRNWYTNKVLCCWVNENGAMMDINAGILLFNLILCAIGFINYVRGADEVHYTLPIVFGITGLIVAAIFIALDKDIDVIRSHGPICGDKKFTREYVDEQANSEDTEGLGYADILLAPDILIGVTAGVAAVAYEDIASLHVKKIWHTKRDGPRGSYRYIEYYTYKIIVTTNKGKKIAISESMQDGEYAAKAIHEHCLKYNPEVKLLDMKYSCLTQEDKEKPVVDGQGVKHSVDLALQEQYLTSISVDEDLKKKFVGYHRRFAFILILESLPVSAIASAILFFAARFIRNIMGAVFLLPAALFPFYAIYNLFSTLKSISKDDIEFYSGEIADKTKQGYIIKGVSYYKFGFIKTMRPEGEPNIGDRVILARLKDGYSLIADNR